MTILQIVSMGLVLFTLIFAIVGLLVAIFYEPKPLSPYEMDEYACHQMREQGWAEEEIESYMNECGGYYVKEKKCFE